MPLGHGVERGGVRRLDRDRAWPHRDDHRGTPTGRAHEPVRGRGPRRGDITMLPTFVPAPGGELRSQSRSRRGYDARGHERGRARPPSQRVSPRHAARSSWRSCASRRCSRSSPSSSAGRPATTPCSSASPPDCASPMPATAGGCGEIADVRRRAAHRRRPRRARLRRVAERVRERHRRAPCGAGPSAQGSGGGGVRRRAW